MGLLQPQFHGNADSIVEKLNEWLSGKDRAALRIWAGPPQNPVPFWFGIQFRLRSANGLDAGSVTCRLRGLQEVL